MCVLTTEYEEERRLPRNTRRRIREIQLEAENGNVLKGEKMLTK